ncbi:TetR family transcriptional regulator [Streptomyces sp. KhCrAH-43]|uniref:TetR family transcriptional regulator n=1 Tax=unclassified Streptomyces TaxID=2593676 RepID=UPI000362D603|nr:MULTISPECIES: TetR family transcriptional regulator [unclassified Streptomyces]MYS36760.1 TetR family transcriptional regulator [Streptomyces sp. SID4920]MYX69231.1 TetR family transcriptional regulator [Streptomyces sp. SID8373]RAJ62081.1 TetR family transcriptional regulator [Streptomyces sp. KhCrAH-43]
MGDRARAERGNETRQLIMAAAERLFAERGVHVVSNRQIGEAAGQANSAAVGYHFGSKTDLVRAVARLHAEEVERLRIQMLPQVVGSGEVRDWVACLVRPITDHMAALGSPTWYARFTAQVMSDPSLHQATVEDSMSSPTVQALLEGLNRCLPQLPPMVHAERGVMARHLIIQMCVERERALAEGLQTFQASWDQLATSLTDAITGIWLAPVTARDEQPMMPR